jgi:hypothetical protein
MEQRSAPEVAAAVRMVAWSLVVAVGLALTLVLAQVAPHPAAEPPDPGPPMQFGSATGHRMPY